MTVTIPLRPGEHETPAGADLFVSTPDDDLPHRLYYEDQKDESLRKSKDYVTNRLPKFLGYFERVLKSKASGNGPWLHNGKLTYADLVLFQVRRKFPDFSQRQCASNSRLRPECVDGVKFMFPKALNKMQESGDYQGVFQLYDAIKERPNVKGYLASERRQKYGNGIYRYYEELDMTGTGNT